ncbi:histidinol-phosphate transaminase [Amycolatopsis saalfeldensis]|uniref:Aromatic amino acid aminotransferase n=1 Tax=Amycolatopsis saalfeldensis TaxID=394193 RepID=A0A1H8YCH7_9PSEU|nr:histidinol-phosphate transaminase [Amycolatopsis saalfeldensis]SEP49711.1 histidinol-phosphate aminotransferase [Amycolatopsis saalfeldensis]
MPSLAPRPDLESLPKYVPGRTILGAIKLASNEVPGGPLPSVRAAITDAMGDVNRYPDSGSQALRERLAADLDVPIDRLAVGCGSVSLCQQLIQAVCGPGDEAMFAWRSFEAYPIVTQVAHAVGVKIPLTDGYGLDLDAMLAAITDRTKLIFVCNPNNPTGTVLHRDEIERFIEAVPEHVLVVLDEAYKEFVTDSEVPDGVEFTRTHNNVAVLRTFSKAYGLAGLRIGYAVASAPIAEALRQVYVAFSVNAIAQVAAIASLDAADELLERCQEIITERERVRNSLVDMGYDIPPTQANFVWFPLGERTVAFSEHMLDRKLIVRPFPGDGARVTIGTPEENDLFLAAAREFLS